MPAPYPIHIAGSDQKMMCHSPEHRLHPVLAGCKSGTPQPESALLVLLLSIQTKMFDHSCMLPHCCRQARKLQDYGLAGVVAYGCLNTIYYSATFVVCWICIADVPKGLCVGRVGVWDAGEIRMESRWGHLTTYACLPPSPACLPAGQGFAAASQAFLKVFATVWAGSQVTKLLRAGL